MGVRPACAAAGQPGGQADGPRFPGTVPPIWNVPARNADFTGRARRWSSCATSSPGAASRSWAQALYGLGGVGKTQLALEYAHRFKADYDLVWWVPSERAEEISLSFAELARRMGLQVGDNVAEAAAAALEELRRDTTPRWLLIFDNADDPKQLEPWLPTGNGHVIITSRNQAWTNTAEPARGGRVHQGRKRRAPAAPRAEPGPGGRQPRSPRPSATCRSRSSRPAPGWSRPGCRRGPTWRSCRRAPPGSSR